jgi:hypothetical protein
MKIFDKSGTHFAEFEQRGDKLFLKSRGFVQRYKPKPLGGGWYSQIQQQQQATESPLIHDGSQNILTTGQDFRNSTLTGTTLSGPSGSGQFLLVTFSTTTRQLTLFTSTMINMSTAQAVYGVCQNKPRPGDAVDVGIFGISKTVAGLGGIVGGTVLQASSTASGVVTPFLGGNGRAVGIAIEGSTVAGTVFSAFIGGIQIGAST